MNTKEPLNNEPSNSKRVYVSLEDEAAQIPRYSITLPLDAAHSLHIQFPYPEEDTIPCDMITIHIRSGTTEHLVFQQMAGVALDNLATLTRKLLAHELKLDKSITNDIGLLWNNYLHDPKNSSWVMCQEMEQGRWVGEKYLALEVPCGVSTWMYEKDGRFFLEVTPMYPWHFVTQQSAAIVQSFQAFIDTYHPLMVIALHEEAVRLLYEATRHMFSVIRKNERELKLKSD